MTARILAASLMIATCTGLPASRSAVLVELFTSEGCSSCPPADALLEALDSPEIVVLSEHVDYWNQLGWADPYSSARYSDRQRTYANRFGLDGVYTPQMVVDGAAEFVGSDRARAKNAIERAGHAEKATVRVFALEGRVRVEVDALPAALQKRGAGVYLALASNEATSQVLSGENRGRRVHHVAVVRDLTQIGELHRGAPFAKEVPLAAASGAQMRVVAFVQERGQGRVLGVALARAW